MLIDTHAHLYWESFREDFDEMIQRTIDAGISTIINIGVDVEKSKEAVQVSKKLALSGVEGYSTIGIHPHEAIKYSESQMSSDRGTNVQRDLANDIAQLKEIYKSKPRKVVAVGECGLDYFFEDNPGFTPSKTPNQVKDLQKKLFKAQIDLAKKLNLPLIVHCRDDRSQNPQNSECWDEVVKMIGNQPAILHCYSGLSHTTNYIIHNTNLVVAFAANITYPKNEYLREAAKLIPLDRIVLETDSPFLAPQSKRGQRNEPSSVKEIAQLIADLKGVPLEEFTKQTTENAVQIFRLRSG